MRKGNIIAILGAGAIGLCTMIAAKQLGATTFMSDPVDFKLNKAKQLGADFAINPKTQDLSKIVKDLTQNKGVDVAIDCAGAPMSLMDCINLVKKDGTVVVTALFKKNVKIDSGPSHKRT